MANSEKKVTYVVALLPLLGYYFCTKCCSTEQEVYDLQNPKGKYRSPGRRLGSLSALRRGITADAAADNSKCASATTAIAPAGCFLAADATADDSQRPAPAATVSQGLVQSGTRGLANQFDAESDALVLCVPVSAWQFKEPQKPRPGCFSSINLRIRC